MVCRRRGVVVLLLLLGGCHALLPVDEVPGSTDAAAEVAARDLAPRDLAPSEPGQAPDVPGDDAGSFCAGITQPTLLCEDFEGAWPPTTWQRLHWDAADKPARVSTPVFAGSFSLRTSIKAGGGFSTGTFSFTAPITKGNINLRAYLNLTADPLPSGSKNFVVMLELTAAEGDPAPFYSKVSFDLGPDGEVFVHCPNRGWITPGITLTQQRWTCVELRVSLDTGAGSLSIDGQKVRSCPAEPSKLPQKGFGSASFGAAGTHPAQVLLDDVVVSRTPVGCP